MIALIGMLSVGLLMPWVVQANPRPIFPTNELPTLTVQAPEPSSPLYANNTLGLHFTVTKPQSWDSYYGPLKIPEVGEAAAFLFLDGEINQAYPMTKNTVDQYTAVFTNLTQQQHTAWIDIYCDILYNGSSASVSQTLTFTINAQAQTIDFFEGPVVATKPGTYSTVIPLQTIPPKISILSPVTQTYNESDVSLVFTVDKPLNWLGYSLDGNQTVTLTGNDTLANVTDGLHSVAVYANDTDGDLSVSTTTFTVYKPEPVPEFPTATVPGVAAVSVEAAAVVVAAGLLVYFKKRKKHSLVKKL